MAMSGGHAAPLRSTAEASGRATLGDYATQTFAVAAAEVQKLYHDPLELLTRAVQPVLWLLLFGGVMARVRGVAPGDVPLPRFFGGGHSRPERPFRGDLLRYRGDLGTRSRCVATLPCQSGAPFRVGAWQGNVGGCAGAFAGADRLHIGAIARRRS